MTILQLTSKEKAKKKYNLHPLYDYPIKCKDCGCNVRATNITGLFECDCNGIIFDYPCGVSIPRQKTTF